MNRQVQDAYRDWLRASRSSRVERIQKQLRCNHWFGKSQEGVVCPYCGMRRSTLAELHSQMLARGTIEATANFIMQELTINDA